MSDFLFEIGCEELPSKAVKQLSLALCDEFRLLLLAHHLSFQSVEVFATPRRLAVLVRDLPVRQPTQTIERRGPSQEVAFDESGKPSRALIGFAKSCHTAPHTLTLEKTEKGSFIFFRQTVEGKETTVLLPEICEEAVARLPLKKPMRWGAGEIAFARPVHWIVMMLDETVIAANILGLMASNVTYGHRFHAPSACLLSHAKNYESALNAVFVMASFDKRKAAIKKSVTTLANCQGAIPVMPQELLEEVTAIVEWPTPLLASFHEKFLTLPEEVLIASMQTHQKCFALKNSQTGKLTPHFITVSNLMSRDPMQVVRGNERVMQARLSDAMFFFEQDAKKTLGSYYEDTAHVIFETKLGSLKDKTDRLKEWMLYFSHTLQLDAADCVRAAELSRSDLMTGMVKEFPELEGTIGYYYALQGGEKKAVAIALKEQYDPKVSGSALPETRLGLALALADRLDNLVGLYYVRGEPKGDKDPFKLRRHALALIRLLVALKQPLMLRHLLQKANEIYAPRLLIASTATDDLIAFILERLSPWYLQQGFSKDEIVAVLAAEKDCLWDFDKRLHALHVFLKAEDRTDLLRAMKRITHLIGSEAHENLDIDTALFQVEAEKNLHLALCEVKASVLSAYEKGEYLSVLKSLTALTLPLDTFLSDVLVNVELEAIKNNRYALLHGVKTLFDCVAHLS